MIHKSIKHITLTNIITAITTLVIFLTSCGNGMKILFQKDKQPGSDKEISSFLFRAEDNLLLSSDSTGIINNTSITAFVPDGTAITGLIPYIEFTGESISPDYGLPEDFSQPVIYTVTAEDKTTVEYTVEVVQAPRVISIISSTSTGYYNAGKQINISVTFSCPLNLNGTFTVYLNTGASVDVTGTYPAATLTGTYTVASGENTGALDAVDIALSGTLQEESGIDAIVEMPDLSISDSKTIVVDTITPNVLITSNAAVTKNTTFTVTAEFSEAITGFSYSDISLTNCSIADPGTDFSEVTAGRNYNIIITPVINEIATISINSNKAFDSAGNGNTAASSINIRQDSTQPSVSITAPSGTNISSFEITITFNEEVTGFELSDIDTSGTASKLHLTPSSGPASIYTADIIASAEGDVTIDIAGGIATDAAGNPNSSAIRKTIKYSTLKPILTITSSESSPTNADPIPVTFTFGTSVTGFAEGVIQVTNGTVSVGNFSGTGAVYTAEINPAPDSYVTISVDADTAFDGSSNGNLAAEFNIVYDGTPPALDDMSSTEQIITNCSPFYITLGFSEVIDTAELTGDDFTCLNCTIGTITPESGSSKTFTVEIVPGSDNTIQVDLNDSSVSDPAGNTIQPPAENFSIEYDGTRPEIVSAAGDAGSTTLTITFSEPVNDNITEADLIYTDGNSSEGATYILTVIDTDGSDGVITVQLNNPLISSDSSDAVKAETTIVDDAGNSATDALEYISGTIIEQTIILRPGDYGDQTLIPNVYPGITHHDATNDQSDTSYVYIRADGSYGNWVEDDYAHDVMSDLGTINRVQIWYHVNKVGTWGGNNVSARANLRRYYNYISQSRYGQTRIISGTGWTEYFDEWTLDPYTGLQWSYTNINSTQIGVSLKGPYVYGSEDQIQCSEVWMVIYYTPY